MFGFFQSPIKLFICKAFQRMSLLKDWESQVSPSTSSSPAAGLYIVSSWTLLLGPRIVSCLIIHQKVGIQNQVSCRSPLLCADLMQIFSAFASPFLQLLHPASPAHGIFFWSQLKETNYLLCPAYANYFLNFISGTLYV